MVAQFTGDDDEATDRERFPAGRVDPRQPSAIEIRVQLDVAPDLWRLRPQLEILEKGLDRIQSEKAAIVPLVQLVLTLYELGARRCDWPLLDTPSPLLEGLTDQEIMDRRAIVQVGFKPGSDVLYALDVVRAFPVVMEANPVPEDAPPFFPADDLLGAGDQDLTRQWYLYRMRVDRAWCFSTGTDVVIADVDYGFFIDHEDLGNLDMTNAFNAQDLSRVVNHGSRITHGTAVMGLAGAAANGMGMVGVAPSVRLWPIQANSAPNPQPDTANKWARGIDYVRVTNSGGMRKVVILENQTSPAGGCYEQSSSTRRAIAQAIAHGVVVVTAAGNGNREVSLDDSGNPYPDCGSILVGATVFHRRHNPRAWFSNYGTRITVSAPGYFPSDVTCFVDPLDPTRKYRPGFGGTSGAAPKVAGVCALMLSANPSLTPRDVKQLLVRTGSEVLTSPDRPGGVFVNARKAVKKALGGC